MTDRRKCSPVLIKLTAEATTAAAELMTKHDMTRSELIEFLIWKESCGVKAAKKQMALRPERGKRSG